ncbi:MULTISPECIES: TetR/AcrR family transcriptional regulator [Corynebacterium]|uniref:TetR/AcrR family transcriptional regulator n=1 Tax=Corynebacterium amycolatum TaxID=43765 RepID=A0AB38XYY0_CORAY|nr:MULTISPECIES: TetR/AcrR family transcriptional regulator [Corynebacterium]AIN81266.1 bacterial regulatory s, tetR family protein [Corynebacterium sp. ATCC 6931]KAA9288251.1 TetR/AcrR family transcriptional regulator [Corynebacterium amycolatum]MBC6726480.1 TetR/AcrR family transcriptional regulator [Corynebacterium amycolatum]MCG7245971.1 TetR/AcrR family transcriptional regulator [Corynebacterium sp. ACRPX]MCT1718219.1 TetR/AcrR family transcriptional regulator [Corynebacterium amycolatum]
MDETSRVGDAAQSNTAAQKPSVDDVIIAAARESVMTVGFRRTSIAEIARKAGVSRPTVYRRYADIGELLAEVTNREILHMLEGLRYVPGDSRARMLLRIRIVVQRIIESDFFPGLVKTDPDRVLEALTGEMSDTQLEIVEKFILPGVRHGQEDGTIREHDPYQLARNIYRLIQTMVLVWRPDGKDAALDKKSVEEVVDMVDRYLRPDPADNKKD